MCDTDHDDTIGGTATTDIPSDPLWIACRVAAMERIRQRVHLYRDNPWIGISGLTLRDFMLLDGAALTAVLFPPEPPPTTESRPLLPAQVRAAMAADRAMPRGPAGGQAPTARLARMRATGPQPFQLRGGSIIEPLKHRAYGHRYRFPGASRRVEG